MSGTDLHGKRILVVGGETAQGRTLAIALAERGADVAIASLTASTEADFAINSALNELWALDRRGVALAIDASDSAALRDAVARAERELGRMDAACAIEPSLSLAEGERPGVREPSRIALDALRAALPERDAIEIRASASVEESLDLVRASLR